MFSRLRVARMGFASIALLWVGQALATEQCMSQQDVTDNLTQSLGFAFWLSNEPQLDFGNMVLALKQDGKAVYRYKESGREIVSSWYMNTKTDQTYQLCLVANPFDSDQECASVYWSLTPEPTFYRHLIFSGQCPGGKTGIRVVSAVELNTGELSPTIEMEETDSGLDEEQGDLPVCGDENVTSTLAELIKTSPKTPEQTFGLRNAGNPKIAYSVKAVRTEVELLKGYLCSAIVTAAVDVPKGNEAGLSVLQMFLEPYGIIGDIDVAYSVKQMDDGQIYVNLE